MSPITIVDTFSIEVLVSLNKEFIINIISYE